MDYVIYLTLFKRITRDFEFILYQLIYLIPQRPLRRNLSPLFKLEPNLILIVLHISKSFDTRGNLKIHFIYDKIPSKEFSPQETTSKKFFKYQIIFLGGIFGIILYIAFIYLKLSLWSCKAFLQNKSSFYLWYLNVVGSFSINGLKMY